MKITLTIEYFNNQKTEKCDNSWQKKKKQNQKKLKKQKKNQ
jgi:hypothetical protein